MPLNPTRRARIIRVATVSAVDVAAVIAALAHFGALDSFTHTHTTASDMLAASAPAYCLAAGV